MIPGRQQLAKQHGVALGTIERAVATLISEGLLRAADRRGTFVTALSADSGRPHGESPPGHAPSQSLVATVGIVAAVVPYESGNTYEGQWPVQVLHGCEHRLAAESGLTIRFLNTVVPGHRGLSVSAAATRLLDEHVDAAILIQPEPAPNVLERFAAAKVPLVLAWFNPCDVKFPQLYIDDIAGGALAARHLFERGYRRLLFFQPFTSVWTEQRLAGVKSAVENLGRTPELRVLPAHPTKAFGWGDAQQTVARNRAQEILAANWKPGTGVIAPNDSAAEGFMAAATARGLVAGRDYGIVGFDDRARACGLTSLRPPLAAMGEEAARLVVRLLRGEDAPSHVALRHRLIARTSTCPWRGAHE